MTQVAESVINKPGKPVASNIPNQSLKRMYLNQLGHYQIYLTLSHQHRKQFKLLCQHRLLQQPVPEIEDNNSPITAENEV